MTHQSELIERLEELLATATPGDWHIPPDDEDIAAVNPQEHGADIIAYPPRDWEHSYERWPANAALIVAMKNALPALLSALKQGSGEDTTLLNAVREECWDLRSFDSPTGGDDSDVFWRVVGHWQAEPCERVVAESYSDDPREAIRMAMASKTSPEELAAFNEPDMLVKAASPGGDVGEVVAVDREAAWPHRPSAYKEADREPWINGRYDTVRVIQAFARHREQCSSPALDRAGEG